MPRGYFGLRQETRYGAGGAPVHFLPATQAAPADTAARRDYSPWGTGGYVPLVASQGAVVQAEVEAQPDGLGHLLTAVLGTPVTTQVASGVWQHVFEPRPGCPSYAVEAGDGNVANRANGVMGGMLTLRLGGGRYLLAGFQAAGRQALPVATATASYATEEAPLWRNATVLIDGTADTAVAEVAVTMTAPYQPVAAVGRTGRPAGVVRAGPTRVAVGMTIQQPTSAWLSRQQGQAEFTWELRAPGSLVGTSSYQVTVSCPRVILEAAPFAATPGLPLLAVQGRAHAAVGAVRGIKVTLVNVTSGY